MAPHRDPNRTRMDRVGPRSSTALLASTDTNVRMPDNKFGEPVGVGELIGLVYWASLIGIV
ncbi:hypothetical protein AG1IA_00126 [Rhizoctonia solani AG-1 IA]|uniref:Uncharacterized protein n=1 Tax=Thanatephorus cucumeris (strain AG1-IA) TaxID=983506 RepID=L8XAY6_THACA|nr:hypothetical protein AG1IA_00126 [Rhizoctonia solani AG-1 IA]